MEELMKDGQDPEFWPESMSPFYTLPTGARSCYNHVVMAGLQAFVEAGGEAELDVYRAVLRKTFGEGTAWQEALARRKEAYTPAKRQVMLRPCSKVVIRFLTVMMKHGYIGEFEVVDDHRSGKIVVNLTGRLNKCGVISPRFDIAINDIEKWTNNLLPSRQFGKVVLTTSGGIMDHEEARRKAEQV